MSARSPLPYHFNGVTSPNTTQVPDQYLDELLPILSGAELKVLLYITRRTFGFKKASDNISLSQMLNGITTKDGRVLDLGCGLSKKTLLGAIKSLESMGVIFREKRRSAERGDEATAYFLNISGGYQPQKRESNPVGGKAHQGGGGESTPGPRGRNSPTQHTAQQHTDFEYSNEEDWEREREEGSVELDQSVSLPVQSTSSLSENSLATLLKHRIRRDAGQDERSAIGAAISQIAGELGDRAEEKSSVSRAMNLYQASETHIGGFIDLLYRSKGETIDRYRNPGRAPVPRNRMAYFFALVEDRLGFRSTAARQE